MAHQTLMLGFVIGADPVLIHIIKNRFFYQVCLRKTDAAAFVFHDLVAACPVKTGIGLIFQASHGEDHFVSVIVAGGGRKNGDLF